MTEKNPAEEAAILEQMQQAKAAPEPGVENLKAEVKGSGKDIPIDEAVDGRPKIKWLGSAGYSYIWDTRTGERSITNNNMLSTQLRKKRPDGSRVFTTIDPKIPVVRGNLKCLLHPDNPERKKYEHIVFTTCRKENLTNPYQVDRHIQKRHPDEWKAIQKEIARQEKEEEKKFREALVGTMSKKKEG